MSVNLEGLSTKELSELISKANQRKKVLAKRKPANQVKAAVAKFLTSVGWTFDELYGRVGPAKPAAASTAPKPARSSTKGRKLVERLSHTVESHYQWLEKSLGKQKLAQLYQLLDELIELEAP